MLDVTSVLCLVEKAPAAMEDHGGGQGAGNHGRGKGLEDHGTGQGVRDHRKGHGPEDHGGGQWVVGQCKTGGSHQPPSERHHPTRGWGSDKLLIVTLLPGLSVCLSFQLSVSLANQNELFQESWKRRRNVSLSRGFL